MGIFKDITCFMESHRRCASLPPPTAGRVEGGHTHECSPGPRAWRGTGPGQKLHTDMMNERMME